MRRHQGKITLPKSNVLLYTLENDCWMCVRPSGTEPKLKIYLATKEDSFDSAEKDLAAMKDEVVKNSICKTINTYIKRE